MSDENTARHAECTVEFDGVDITSSIKPYLLSLTFTDNEEDASDDLQIKLQDREGVWMTDWLQKMLDGDVSAASSDGYKVGDVVQFLGGPHYKASTDKKANGTPKAGPAKITIIKQGALHPYHVIHTDGTSRVYGWVDASEISGKSGGSSSGSSEGGLKIRATITACNWHSDGKDEALDCGEFELDSINASGPPDIITIKATGLPYVTTKVEVGRNSGGENRTGHIIIKSEGAEIEKVAVTQAAEGTSVTGIVIRDHKVLLARHTYGVGKNRLIVPGGYLEPGETPQEALRREYLEETSIVVEPKEVIGILQPERLVRRLCRRIRLWHSLLRPR